jgi:hypothetical protein
LQVLWRKSGIKGNRGFSKNLETEKEFRLLLDCRGADLENDY